MSKRTLSIGGATYDLFVRLPATTATTCEQTDSFALPLGAKIKVDNLVEACGGGASNTSVGLSRLGCDACFEGIIATDQWGEKLMENLRQEGVDTRCITQVEDEVSSFSIILSGSNGERVILYEPGTNTHLHDANFNKAILESMDWVYLNHIQEGSCIIQDDITDMLAADDSPHLTWNPGGCQIDMGFEPKNNQELLAHTDLLLVNKQEALAFTQQTDVNEALKRFLDAGVHNVCITDGSRGTTASDGQHIYHCPVVPGSEIIDTTGAGDAFGTGATWALLTGLDLPTALKAGSINGASVVGAIGAQTALLTDIEMNRRLSEIDLDVAVLPLS